MSEVIRRMTKEQIPSCSYDAPRYVKEVHFDSAVACLREIAKAADLPYCAHQGIKARDWLREHGL
jgi:hypothetical protein